MSPHAKDMHSRPRQTHEFGFTSTAYQNPTHGWIFLKLEMQMADT